MRSHAHKNQVVPSDVHGFAFLAPPEVLTLHRCNYCDSGITLTTSPKSSRAFMFTDNLLRFESNTPEVVEAIFEGWSIFIALSL